ASRRRHTTFSRDWSSDVCSSDHQCQVGGQGGVHVGQHVAHHGNAVETLGGQTEKFVLIHDQPHGAGESHMQTGTRSGGGQSTVRNANASARALSGFPSVCGC